MAEELKLLFVKEHVVRSRPLDDLVEICLGLNHITDRVYSASNSGDFGNFGNFGKFETRSQLSSSGSARLLVTVHSKILLLLAAT